MDLKQRLDTIVEKWNLLNHPFYQAWSEGRLPKEALQTYAREYGAFIARIPDGWATLGDQETSDEEVEHFELWKGFAKTLDTEVSEAEIPQVRGLVDHCTNCFGDRVPALGSLYAFEVQQPATAQSKMDGLRDHYDLPGEIGDYFAEHLHNEHESEALVGWMGEMSQSDQDIAVGACESTCEGLWDALTGIYGEEC